LRLGFFVPFSASFWRFFVALSQKSGFVCEIKSRFFEAGNYHEAAKLAKGAFGGATWQSGFLGCFCGCRLWFWVLWFWWFANYQFGCCGGVARFS
jgi:hypothetical protein